MVAYYEQSGSVINNSVGKRTELANPHGGSVVIPLTNPVDCIVAVG